MCSSHSREFCGWNWTSFTLQFTCSRPSWFVVLGVGATSISTMQGHALRRIAPNRKNECFGESSGAFGGLHGHLKEWHIYAECYNLQKEMVNTSEGHYHQCNSCHDIGQHKFLKSKKHTDIARMRFSLAQRARVAQHEKQLSHRGIALAWPWSGWLGSSCSSCKTNVGSRIGNLTTWLRANQKESTWRSDAPHVLPLQIQKKLWDLFFVAIHLSLKGMLLQKGGHGPLSDQSHDGYGIGAKGKCRLFWKHSNMWGIQTAKKNVLSM